MSEGRFGWIVVWPAPDDPAALARIITALQDAKWLDPDACWWYGWQELELDIPQRLSDAGRLPTDRDMLVVFGPQCELRQVRRGRGRQVLLLHEQPELPAALTNIAARMEQYHCRPSLHILEGGPLQLPEGPAWGNVALPRPLNYDLADGTAPTDHVVVADVVAYYDDEARLRTLRYSRLRRAERGGTLVQSVQPLIRQ